MNVMIDCALELHYVVWTWLRVH